MHTQVILSVVKVSSLGKAPGPMSDIQKSAIEQGLIKHDRRPLWFGPQTSVHASMDDAELYFGEMFMDMTEIEAGKIETEELEYFGYRTVVYKDRNGQPDLIASFHTSVI